MRVCVFCSSSDAVDDVYRQQARRLGELLGHAGHDLVYGGADAGLMRALAEGAAARGAHVTGVIPRSMVMSGLARAGLDELVITADMAERKAEMERLAEAFIVLPGGFGTLEELFGVLTAKQLGEILAPLLIVNVVGYWDQLLDAIEQLYALRFAKPEFRALYEVCDDVDQAVAQLGAPTADATLPPKWF